MSKEQHKEAVDNIAARLKQAGVQKDETEDISYRYGMLVDEWRVPPSEAIRTVTTAILKKHGINTKGWTPGGSSVPVKVDQIAQDNEWINLKGKVVQIWDNRSDAIERTGLIGDETGVIKFTIFKKNEDIIPEQFVEGKSYNFQNFVTSIWQGQFSIKSNKTSKIEECENINAARKTEQRVGLIVSILDGSGMIKRCPECNRAIVKGSCQEHGKVQGKHDMRIKAVFSEYGSNKNYDLIVGTGPTEKVMGMKVSEAMTKCIEEMDTEWVTNQLMEIMTGKYYEVDGSVMQDTSILVTDINPAKPCTKKEIEKAIQEIKGGN